MELKGTIKKINDIQTFASGFQKREFILTTNEQYPQPISIELMGDKIDIISPFKEGDYAEVGINIMGREWVSPQGDTKYFNTIKAWKITRPAGQSNSNSTAVPQASAQQAFGNNDDGDDDLPF